MKKTKRLGIVLLALTIVLSMGITAFAADDPSMKDFEKGGGGTIVIHKYDYTDVTLTSDPADGTQKNGNTVVGTKEVDDGAGGTTLQDVTLGELTKLPGIAFTLEEVALKTGGDPADPDDYAVKTSGITSTLKTGADGTLTWANLPEGIYRITELENDTTDFEIPAFLVRLPFTNPADTTKYLDTVHVYPKNTVTPPDIDKTPTTTVTDGSGNVINPGSILGWKLTADIPNDIKTAKSYIITDTPSTYLSYVTGSLKVYYKDAGGAEVKFDEDKSDGYGGDYTLSTAGGKITVTLTIEGKARLGAAILDETIEASKKLYVEYSTKINITAEQMETLIAAGGNKLGNTAQIDFTNEAGHVYKSDTDEEETKVYGLKIAKVDKDGAAITSKDAKFSIYTTLKNGAVDTASIVADADGNTEFTTDEDGHITVAGLAAGTYYIVETQAPESYNLLTGYVTVTIVDETMFSVDNGSAIEYHADTGLIEFSITNLKGFALPLTGGMGSILFIGIGLALIVTAGVCIVLSRKKKTDESNDSTNM